MQIHFLVEGVNEKRALNIILPKIILDKNIRYFIHPFEGKGKIGKKLKNDRTLLGNLPQQLRAFNTSCSTPDKIAVVILFDLDDDPSCVELKLKVSEIVKREAPNLSVLTRIAVEEFESWYLGDIDAIAKAYRINKTIFNGYKNDSIICTWEYIIGKLYPKQKASELAYKKKELAEQIPPYMEIDRNKSPSFKAFIFGIKHLI